MTRSRNHEEYRRQQRIDDRRIGALLCTTFGTFFALGGIGDAQPDRGFDVSCANVSSAPDEWLRVRADECLARRSGTVALVSYGFSQEQAATLASNAEAAIDTITGGRVRPDIVPVLPSLEAMTAFASANPGSCATSDMENGNDPASIADKSMDLDEYDIVLGTTTMQPCDRHDGGALTGSEDRYASVYNVTPESRPWTLGVMGHEILHLHGLGHADRYDGADAIMSVTVGKTVLPAGDSRAAIDLNSYTSGGTYREYGERCNIMGSTSEDMLDSYPRYLNPMQLQELEWPERVKGDVADKAVPITTRKQTLHPQDQQYGLIDLDSPLSIHTQDPAVTPGFKQLAFVPLEMDCYQGALDGHTGVTVYVFDETSTGLVRTVQLLTIMGRASDELDRHRTVAIGDQNVHLTFYDNGDVSVRSDTIPTQ